ncbi:class I SAM-dependent DNA methyltransferase [Salinigranum sp. GCM10025319]|uniref:class I SAM-dependent DNA methyltransferase n=1 Tax=Salinigranum sp. GCM10025319 TaxID=3252687 RepID=UPI00361B43FB
MSRGGIGVDGFDRLREALPTRFGDCRVRLRPASATPPATHVVEFAADGARATLALWFDGGEDGDADPLATARRTAVALGVDEGGLYGVVRDGRVTVYEYHPEEDPGSGSNDDGDGDRDAGGDPVVCTAVPTSRLRSVLALVAWRVQAETATLYARFDALRRAVEPLADARLTARLDDPTFAERLRDSLRPAGPATDEVAFGDDERASLAAQASCLFVDALVAAGVEPGATDTHGRSSCSTWAALLARIRAGTDDPLFDPETTPLADVALHSTESVAESTVESAVDAAAATSCALDRSTVSLGESVLARLFERLLPKDRRWRWGQVYTPPAVARLLADWVVAGDGDDDEVNGVDRGDDEDDGAETTNDPDAVFDPACGTGRLLRAAVESRRDAGRPPPAVYGRDVFALPAALAARSLPDAVDTDVTAGDFFTCASTMAENGEANREHSEDATVVDQLPSVDGVLMNPPYTRREALDDDYVSFVRRTVAGGSTVGRGAGLAPYFIRHAASFLDDGGRMGVVVGSSWLDADYGASLKSFLLDTFRVRAVVGAPRHHLVETADVNAVLLLLERVADPAERDETDVAFVRFRTAPTDLAFEDDVFSALLDGPDRGGAAGRTGTVWCGSVDDGETVDGWTISDETADGDERPSREQNVEVVRRRQATLRWATDDGRQGRGTSGSDGVDATDDARDRRDRKWGRYVRAPSAYWTVHDRCGDRLVDFHDLAAAGWARLSYGTRSGAPDFFYLPNPHHDVAVDGDALRVVPRDGTGLDDLCRLPRRYWMHRPSDEGWARPTGDDDWRPNYLLKRTTGVGRLRFDVADLDLGTQLRYVLRFSEAREDLGPAARAYVEWGETHDVTACPHCRRAKPFPAYCAGERWYDITGGLTRGTVLPNKDVHATHAYWTPSTPLWVHQSLYGIDADDPPLLAALVNSTLGLLMLEVAGRVNLGEGALDLMTSDHRSVRVPDPRTVDPVTRDRLVERFEAVASRPIGTVFEECGARRRSEVTLGSVARDRRALDSVVMGDVLGLSDGVQESVYRGVVGLVDDRLTKAARGR